MRLTRFTLLAAALAFAACAKPDSAADEAAQLQADTDSARAAITPRVAALAAAISSGNPDSAAAYYADNAVFMPPNMPTVTGRAGIREAFAGMAQGMGTGTMHFTVQNVSASGDLAVERGKWHWSGTMNGQAHADSGKYLVHWHKMGGNWMIVEDIFNADTPAMPAPPARRN